MAKQQDFPRAAEGETEHFSDRRHETLDPATFLINSAPPKHVKIIFKVGREQLSDPSSTLATITPQPTEPAKVKMISVTIVILGLTNIIYVCHMK